MLSERRLEEIAREIVESVTRGKSDDEIARWSQDAVDAEVFPMIQQIENYVDERVSEAISTAFSRTMNNRGDKKWWL